MNSLIGDNPNHLTQNYKTSIGVLTSVITNLSIQQWGRNIILDCLYGPKRVWYQIYFQDCKEFSWVLLDSNIEDKEMMLIDIQFGQQEYYLPAVVYTNHWEFTIWYKNLHIRKTW